MEVHQIEEILKRYLKLSNSDKDSVFTRILGYIFADIEIYGAKDSIKYIEHVEKVIKEKEINSIEEL